MADSTLWWIATGALISVELLTGTLYLLMVASGLVVAALVAHAGASMPWQVVSAAVVSSASVLVWRQIKKSRPSSSGAQTDPQVNLDIGQTVQVTQWREDGTCSVKYRGASWEAICRPGEPLTSGSYTIVEVVGSRLWLTATPLS